jgi:hypothetical protein
MAVRGDDVASSIEAHVRESIERMVGEIRSSVDDVRAAVDSQLNAAVQSVQADVSALSFLPHIRKAIAQLEQAPAAAAAPAKGGGDAKKVKRALQAIERGKSQVDVLNALLEQCLEFGSRAALLILRDKTFSGWKGAGFSSHGGNDETIKRFNAAPGLVPQLDELLQNEHGVEWDGATLATRFGVAAPARAVLVPMVIKDKVSAAVYVDAVPEDLSKLDRASIEILVYTTGLLVDTLAIRKKIPSPSLSDDGQQAAAPAPHAAAPAPAAPRPAAAAPRPAPAPAPAPGPRPVPAPAPAEPTAAFSAAQIRDMTSPTAIRPPAPRPAPAAAPPPAPRPAPAATPPPAPAPRPTPVPQTAPPLHGDDRPSTQFVPPSGVQRGGAFAGGGTEESKKHDEARRFARLLVSEIKLYNESKVDAGRKNRDLYERLKEDIDRSRQMYDERIAEDVRKSSNYFYDELVRILADGNADSLGL